MTVSSVVAVAVMVAVTVVVGFGLDGFPLPVGLGVGLPVAAVTVNVAVEALPSHVTDTVYGPAVAEVAMIAVPDRVPALEVDWFRVTGAEKAVEAAWTPLVVVQPVAVIDRDCPAATPVGLTVTVAATAGVAAARATAAASTAVQTTREFIVDGSHRPVRSGTATSMPWRRTGPGLDRTGAQDRASLMEGDEASRCTSAGHRP
ncbi:hypothetical protein AB0442_39405 [Kitasatospora sp. NPDC085895]|uniref:hypothetical protein n=1 Tax=Kitasatospora sp. NPDC085895 TaxID=3155057 RepID=UPI00344E9DB9